MPKVSVCVPTYRPKSFLTSALRSIQAQSFSDFEIIVVDDASEQSPEAVVEALNEPRLTFYRNSRRLGLVGNWNRCIEFATGEYIAIFHQDDEMLPDNLAEKVRVLESHSQVGFVHSNICTIDRHGAVTGGHWADQPPFGERYPGHKCFAELALRGNFVSCPSVVVRAECYKTLGKFDSRLPFSCDMEMWMRISSRYEVAYIAIPLVANRRHRDQETERFAQGREVREVHRAIDIALATHAPIETARALRRPAHRNLLVWATRLGRWRAQQRDFRAALGYLYAGLELLPGIVLP